MSSSARLVSARKLLALVGIVAIAACSDDSNGPTSLGSRNSLSGGTNGDPAPSDTSHGVSPGEWHLATIRGVVLGVTSSAGLVDTISTATKAVAGAKVDIHKFEFKSTTGSAGDSASMKLQDLGVVATLTADASGRFEYVLSDPIIVKSGQPSPTTTYRLTITPPADSPFAAQSDVQVYFMEQFPSNSPAVNYYLYPIKK